MGSAYDDAVETSVKNSSCTEIQISNKREPKMQHKKPQSEQSVNRTRFEFKSIRIQDNCLRCIIRSGPY